MLMLHASVKSFSMAPNCIEWLWRNSSPRCKRKGQKRFVSSCQIGYAGCMAIMASNQPTPCTVHLLFARPSSCTGDSSKEVRYLAMSRRPSSSMRLSSSLRTSQCTACFSKSAHRVRTLAQPSLLPEKSTSGTCSFTSLFSPSSPRKPISLLSIQKAHVSIPSSPRSMPDMPMSRTMTSPASSRGTRLHRKCHSCSWSSVANFSILSPPPSPSKPRPPSRKSDASFAAASERPPMAQGLPARTRDLAAAAFAALSATCK
mmetsp:Transcript_122502/g.341431  ORF Transcript_122502/g.341431 Transcript_122502/m.341431 type:complete len:259 (-) Transcript_122502:839-1615(-)